MQTENNISLNVQQIRETRYGTRLEHMKVIISRKNY